MQRRARPGVGRSARDTDEIRTGRKFIGPVSGSADALATRPMIVGVATRPAGAGSIPPRRRKSRTGRNVIAPDPPSRAVRLGPVRLAGSPRRRTACTAPSRRRVAAVVSHASCRPAPSCRSAPSCRPVPRVVPGARSLASPRAVGQPGSPIPRLAARHAPSRRSTPRVSPCLAPSCHSTPVPRTSRHLRRPCLAPSCHRRCPAIGRWSGALPRAGLAAAIDPPKANDPSRTGRDRSVREGSSSIVAALDLSRSSSPA